MLNYPEYLKLTCSSGLLQADLELASHPLASGSELVVHACALPQGSVHFLSPFPFSLSPNFVFLSFLFFFFDLFLHICVFESMCRFVRL